jgi:tRNA (guanine-N7-)-methyltransferase
VFSGFPPAYAMTDTPRDPASTAARRRYLEGASKVPDVGLDLTEVFPEGAEIEMEIGFGRGAFLIGRAQAAPEACLLGIERKLKWAFLVAERCRSLGLGRVRAMAGDAQHALPRMRPDGALARVYLHFPDPWWKKRHAKRRMMTPEFLVHVARLLRSGGELFVQTDVPDRFAAIALALREHGGFDVRTLAENPYGSRSNREARAIADGVPVHRLVAVRRTPEASAAGERYAGAR